MTNKKYHLISNAHIDPVWQWEWEEGCAAALSTFRCAVSFCRQFNNYIFCHNEALIYRWVEEFEPALFEEIKELVHLGKWHIMGGWFVQPDCNLPSGEAFARQVAEGRRYFKEKFGKEPTTAINFDPFGHTRGLVQILAKSGYDSYLFCRPGEGDCALPAETFTWVGYDGSEVMGQRCGEGYGSGLGRALDKIRAMENRESSHGLNICLWGVGDHGGGPSRQDIAAINAYIEKCRKQGVEVIHSTPEAYFAEIKTSGAPLPRHEGDLNSWAPGCYTSQIRIKQMYRQIENMLFSTEKMYAHLSSLGRIPFPEAEFGEVLYDMLTIQFHDILPGSSVQPAEDMALRMLSHGTEILSRLRLKAFLALSENQPEAAEGEIPVLVYNPHPFPITEDITCEFMLADQNWSGSFKMPQAYKDGVLLPSQCEKEDSNIPLDWRKRVVFSATLNPMSMNRFDLRLTDLPAKPTPDPVALGGDDPHLFRFTTPHMTVEIDRSTGLLNSFTVDGISYIGQGACGIHVMRDGDDSWGMTYTEWKDKIGEFSLLSPEDGSAFSDQDQILPSIRVIEDGAVRTVVEAVLGYNGSRAVLRYKLSKTAPIIDVDLLVINQEKRKMFKLAIPMATPQSIPDLEVAFGQEPMTLPYHEYVGQKYLTVTYPWGGRLSVLNRGTYGYSRQEGIAYLTLLHSPGYTAHPLGDRKVMPTDRYCDHMEQGERRFSFRLAAHKATDSDVARLAQTFNEAPMPLSFFPQGGEAASTGLQGDVPFMTLSPSPVIITALTRRTEDRALGIRLFNPTAQAASCTVSCPIEGIMQSVSFAPYEVKTYHWDGCTLIPCRMDEL